MSDKRYRIPIYRVQLVKEGSGMIGRESIGTPRNACDAARLVLDDLDREALAVIMLDTRCKIIGINVVSVGAIDQTLVVPANIFKPALLCNAASIILAHNHPSGDPTPSPEDRAVSLKIMTAGDMLGIPLLDHVVIGHDSFVSLKERGLI